MVEDSSGLGEPQTEQPTEVQPPTELATEVKSPADQLVEQMRTAGDTMSLMDVVTHAEGSGNFSHNKDILFTYAHENAVRLQDREAALMYGNRAAAEVMSKTVDSMHNAVGGMMDSANSHRVAGDTMLQAADMHRRNSYQG